MNYRLMLLSLLAASVLALAACGHIDSSSLTSEAPELSGTGFITFGLAWGVNTGILQEQKYKQSVVKGWKAIEQAVASNGRVNYAQQVGKSPDSAKKDDTQLYRVAAVLLAASEMTKWNQ